MTRTAENLSRRLLFVVETQPNNKNHHGLHTCTAPHLLTPRPEAGDKIVLTIDLSVWSTSENEALYARVYQGGAWQLRTHAGRSALLGEDGLDDTDGYDAIADLVPEILGGAQWNYAPCTLETAPDTEEGDTWIRKPWKFTKTDAEWVCNG